MTPASCPPNPRSAFAQPCFFRDGPALPDNSLQVMSDNKGSLGIGAIAPENRISRFGSRLDCHYIERSAQHRAPVLDAVDVPVDRSKVREIAKAANWNLRGDQLRG